MPPCMSPDYVAMSAGKWLEAETYWRLDCGYHCISTPNTQTSVKKTKAIVAANTI